MKVYIDGQILDEADAKISVFDHGLLYGDGVFEGIRMYNGRVFRLEEHIRRLYDSAKVMLLDVGIDPQAMTDAVLDTIRANGLTEGYVRLVVTRGVGTLGLNPFQCPKATVIVIAANITLYAPEKYENGLKVVTCSTRRPTPASLSPSVKSLNYLNNVMAKVEAIHADADEGLMLNEQGFVAECTGDNLFIIRDGKITTPPVSAGALPGITWKIIFDIAKEKGVSIEEKQMTRYEIYTADEAFLTGTAAEVIPMVSLDRRLVGDGKPGKMTTEFIARFREIANSTGVEI
ncbi:MAG: branched-chain amino acid aminotransferase [Pseudoalteromonas tetraodonis]|jgi:branched-chain amino acid aminotransferase